MWATEELRVGLIALTFGLSMNGTAHAQNRPFANELTEALIDAGAKLQATTCHESIDRELRATRRIRSDEGPSFVEGLQAAEAASIPDGSCLTRQPDLPKKGACGLASGASRSANDSLCADAVDAVQTSLATQGKAGAKLAAARAEALDILRSDNACSEWFTSKDPDPAATLLSLAFEIDRQGQADVLESKLGPSSYLFRQPYVARATQDGGAYTTVTINANGAFYRQQTHVERVSLDGGPQELDGMRVLTVGVYSGDSAEARLVTLLHELGHVIDLLPQDSDSLDGSSLHNTETVLRHCRAAIESQSKQRKELARR